MAVPTVADFFLTLERSQLFAKAQWEKLRAAEQQVQDPTELARKLVKAGWVTAWQAQQLLTGQHEFLLGKYLLLEKIGEGGMGAVYRAQQVGLKRIVALKVISPKQLQQEHALARFLREVRAAAALRHQHIVQAYDADQVGETYFLVMEYVAGKDLNDWVKHHAPLPVNWCCECARQVAVGLQHAHEQGLVHRDIKPSNILVAEGPAADDPFSEPPLVKILDMGLVRNVAADTGESSEITQTGQIVGTPDYIAPEQARNTKTADIRADIFSLGCTLFKLLTGEPPYTGANAMEKLMARGTEDAPRVRTRRPEIPQGLDDVLAQMLARKPDDRYQTPAAVAAALAPYSMSPAPEADTLAAVDDPPTLVDQQLLTPENELSQFLQHFPPGETTGFSPSPLPAALQQSQSQSRRLLLGLLALAGVLVFVTLLGMTYFVSDPEPTWPARTEGLVFAWHVGQPAPAWEFREKVTLDAQGLKIQGGAVLLDAWKQPLFDACRRSHQLTLEAILIPANAKQSGPARIITFSADAGARNFTFGQEANQFVLRLRTSKTDHSPTTWSLCPLTPQKPQHILITYQPGQLRCFLNGEEVLLNIQAAGDFSTWDVERQHFLLGDEWTGQRLWPGEMRAIAVYARALDKQEAQANYLYWARRLPNLPQPKTLVAPN